MPYAPRIVVAQHICRGQYHVAVSKTAHPNCTPGEFLVVLVELCFCRRAISNRFNFNKAQNTSFPRLRLTD